MRNRLVLIESTAGATNKTKGAHALHRLLPTDLLDDECEYEKKWDSRVSTTILTPPPDECNLPFQGVHQLQDVVDEMSNNVAREGASQNVPVNNGEGIMDWMRRHMNTARDVINHRLPIERKAEA